VAKPILDFTVQMRSVQFSDGWEAVAGAAMSFSRGFRHWLRGRMSERLFCLAAVLVMITVSGLPAQACKAQSRSASLCTIVPLSADVRNTPDGRVAYNVSGKVLVAGHSRNGLWARIEVPCVGYTGWIARQDLACEDVSASTKL
jgi:hypothetical protein